MSNSKRRGSRDVAARVLVAALAAVGIAGALVLTWAGLVVTGVVGDGCPSVADLRAYRPPEATRVFAMDGSVVADLSPQRRTVRPLDAMPAVLRDGMVAVEDRRFHRHRGVDPRAVVRAAWRNVTSASIREGFSTITMQLARTVFPERMPMSERPTRKACEIWLAHRIEAQLGKDEILEFYLNQIYLGAGLYGVEAAAQGYFGVPVEELGPAQAALLIALVRSPEGYNPRRHSERALERRNVVLGVMARAGVIEAGDAAAAMDRPLGLAPPHDAAGRAPYFVAAVRRALAEEFGPEADILGLRVYTGLDPDVQRHARAALVGQIERVESGAYGRYTHATGASSDPDRPTLQGMVVVLDPWTGEVRALVGGRDFATSQFDRAIQARRQPGSAFKPVVYATALEAGLPATARIETGPVTIQTAGSPVWQPEDHVGDTVPSLSMRRALAVSSNHAAVRLGQWVGEPRVAAMGRRLGLSTPIPAYPSIHLGSAEVVPAELVAAYAAFANGGYRVEPTLIRRVEDPNGRVLWRAPASRHQVLDPGVAFLGLTLMEEVVNTGTAAGIRSNGFWLPAAGKTGTTNQNRDVWFIGMTPDLVAGVWLGFDRPRPIVAGAGGGRIAAPVWAELMTNAYRDRPVPAPWAPPANVVSAQVDETTGYLATGRCDPADVRVEYFLAGTEPRSYCPNHPEPGMDRFLESLWRRVRQIF